MFATPFWRSPNIRASCAGQPLMISRPVDLTKIVVSFAAAIGTTACRRLSHPDIHHAEGRLWRSGSISIDADPTGFAKHEPGSQPGSQRPGTTDRAVCRTLESSRSRANRRLGAWTSQAAWLLRAALEGAERARAQRGCDSLQPSDTSTHQGCAYFSAVSARRGHGSVREKTGFARGRGLFRTRRMRGFRRLTSLT